MEVKIGVVYTPRELVVEYDGSAEDIEASVGGALREGLPVLWLKDAKGRRVGIPTDKIAYVEVGSDEESRQVGFGRV